MKHLAPVFFAVVLIALCTLLPALPASAISRDDVKYVGGTVATLHIGVVGQLDPTSQTRLTYRAGSTTLTIPYDSIVSLEYRSVVAHHLGVLPFIAVSVVKKRQMRHEIRLVYEDDQHEKQVGIFEVSKDFPRAMMPALKIRCPVAFLTTHPETPMYGQPVDRDLWR
jgi:hypothetical protein